MGCSCHINPPCPYCLQSYVCEKCNRDLNTEDVAISKYCAAIVCEECFPEPELDKEESK